MKKYFSRLYIIHNVYRIVIGTFFTIFVYRVTGDILLALGVLMVRHLGYVIGFMMSAFLSGRYKISSLISAALVSNGLLYILLGLFFTDNVVIIFLFAFIQSAIWSFIHNGRNLVHQNFLTNVFDAESLLVRLKGIVVIIGVVIPVFVGFIAEDFGYQSIFILFGFFLISQSTPKKNSLLEKDAFTIKEFEKLLSTKGTVSYSILSTFIYYISQLRNLSMVLAGFLLLAESEKNLGIVITLGALLSGVVGIFFSGASTSVKHKIAHAGGIAHALGNVVVVTLWNGLGFTIRSIVSPIADIFYDPVVSNVEVRIRQRILGKESESEGLEFVLLREILYFVARVLAFMTMLVGMYFVKDYLTLSRYIFGIFVLWPSAQLLMYVMFERSLGK